MIWKRVALKSVHYLLLTSYRQAMSYNGMEKLVCSKWWKTIFLLLYTCQLAILDGKSLCLLSEHSNIFTLLIGKINTGVKPFCRLEINCTTFKNIPILIISHVYI